jgi:hypothetical protein
LTDAKLLLVLDSTATSRYTATVAVGLAFLLQSLFPVLSARWCQEFATGDRVIDLSNDNKKEQKTMCKVQAGRKSYISLLASSQEKMELK